MLTLSSTQRTPYPYLQLVSFFGYTVAAMLLKNVTTWIVYGHFDPYIYYKSLICSAHPFFDRKLSILASALFIGLRIGLVWLLTRFVSHRDTVINALLRESVFGLYLADLVYVLAFPISVLAGQDSIDWYYGSLGNVFQLAYTVHLSPLITFLFTGLVCLWLHSRADRFSASSFLLRFGLCALSLCLYIAWVDNLPRRY